MTDSKDKANEAVDKAEREEALEAETAAEPEVVEEAEAGAEPGDEPGAAEGEAGDLIDAAQLAAELAETKDKYVRLQAEWDNYRKRTAAERAAERSRATERLVENLLQVVDDMERAIENSPAEEGDPMLEGIKAVYAKFTDILAREGLTAIAPEGGEAFDIHVHQAVSTVEDASVPEESIAQVYQKGYRMGDKLLRPAMVVTTTGGPRREKQDEE